MRSPGRDGADGAREAQAGGVLMSPRLNICLSLYRYMANAFPHEFRIVYGEDLDRLGEDAVPEAWRRYGVWGRKRSTSRRATDEPSIEHLFIPVPVYGERLPARVPHRLRRRSRPPY